MIHSRFNQLLRRRASAAGGASGFVYRTGTSGADLPAGRIVSDADGNMYSAAYMNGTDGTFVQKISPLGVRLWRIKIARGTGITCYPQAMALRGSYVYVMIHADQGSASSTVYPHLFKLNTSDGSLVWISRANASFGYQGLTVDSSDNVYAGLTTTGSFSYPTLVKFNSSGAMQWQRQISIDGGGQPAVAVDSSTGDSYWAGSLNLGGGNRDAYLVKLSSSGTITWSRSAATATVSNADTYSCALMGSDGRVYVAGATANAGGAAATVGCYDTSGTAQWHTVLGASGGTTITGLIEAEGNLYAYGNAGNEQIIWKLTLAGVVVWVRSITSGVSTSPYGLANVDLGKIGFTFFSSNGAGGFGGSDWLIATQNKDGSTPVGAIDGFTYAATSSYDAVGTTVTVTSRSPSNTTGSASWSQTSTASTFGITITTSPSGVSDRLTAF